jgi:hypothetical protein
MTRYVPDRLYVCHPGQCCQNWCYLTERREDEVHNLPRDPALYGIAPVTVARCMTARDWADGWFWDCNIERCPHDSSGEVAGADQWAACVAEALAHLAEVHP